MQINEISIDYQSKMTITHPEWQYWINLFINRYLPKLSVS